jgi:isopenicillin N synthase-like dioxygenase
VLSGVLLFQGFKQKQAHDRLQSEGQEVLGQIIRVEEKSGRRGRRTYWATVEYVDARQQKFSNTFQISKELHDLSLLGRVRFDDPEPDRSIALVYWPNDPNISQLRGQESKHNRQLGSGALLALLAVGLLFQPMISRANKG